MVGLETVDGHVLDERFQLRSVYQYPAVCYSALCCPSIFRLVLYTRTALLHIYIFIDWFNGWISINQVSMKITPWQRLFDNEEFKTKPFFSKFTFYPDFQNYY